MPVTLKDIAHRTGLSVTTVSRILNNRESGVPIREATRQKVLAVATELGYRPNLLARGLRGNSSSLIGVIVRDISEAFLSQVLKGIDREAVQRGYRLFLGHVERKLDTTIVYGSMFEQSHADGIIIIGDIEDDELAIETLTRHHRYVVGVTDRTSRRAFPGVYADSEHGTLLAMNHLWALGHRRIACVSDPQIHDGILRVKTYERFMREHGLAGYIDAYETSRSPEGGYRVGGAILARPDRPTAIFAATDLIAIGLLQAAYQAAITVPEQLSIVGYDDIEVARYLVPPLTTVSQSGFEMGHVAAAMLIEMIEHEMSSAEVEDIRLTPSLVVRESTSARPVAETS